MGAWGTGLYQDDLALDMKDYYLHLSGKESSGSNESIGRVLREAFSEVMATRTMSLCTGWFLPICS